MTDPLPTPNKNVYPPIFFNWVENDPRYIKGVVRLVLSPSGVTFFTIVRRRQNIGLFSPAKYKYELSTDLRNASSNHRIGGYFDTLDEAKSKAEELATIILRGHDFVKPQTP